MTINEGDNKFINIKLNVQDTDIVIETTHARHSTRVNPGIPKL